jgi:hypothetical protein
MLPARCLGTAALKYWTGIPMENVDVVRALLEPFTGINVAGIDWSAEAVREAIRSVHAPEVVLRTLRGVGIGVDAEYRGLDGLVRYLGDWLEPFSSYRVEALDYIEADNCVLVPSHQWGIGEASGAQVELKLTTLYELRGGQITRIEQYDTVEDARKAMTAA